MRWMAELEEIEVGEEAVVKEEWEILWPGASGEYAGILGVWNARWRDRLRRGLGEHEAEVGRLMGLVGVEGVIDTPFIGLGKTGGVYKFGNYSDNASA